MIKISLILPVYNTAIFLEKCVRSCELQDLSQEEFEVIIVNDGSTDNSLKVATDLKSIYSNIIILNQNNQGVSMARNNGAEIARGKYIWFIDSDDFITKNCLAKIVNIMDSKELDMFGVGPSITFVTDFPDNFKPDEHLTKEYGGAEWLLYGMQFIGAWAYVFKKEFFYSLGFGFYPQIYFEDSEFIPKAFYKAKRICSLSKFSCYSYVQREGSIMNSPLSEKKINDIGKIVISFCDFIISEDLKGLTLMKFRQLLSQQYIAGISGIVRLQSLKLLNDWLNSIPTKFLMIYGVNMFEKLFQLVAYKSPRLFYQLKKMGGVMHEVGNKRFTLHFDYNCGPFSFSGKMSRGSGFAGMFNSSDWFYDMVSCSDVLFYIRPIVQLSS